MYGMPPELAVNGTGGVRIVTLNRPAESNAVNAAMHEGLARVWRHIDDDVDARVVVITGAGGAFSGGRDTSYLADLRCDAKLQAKAAIEGRDLVLGMTRCRVPVVAAVNGPAIGLGCTLVALSDLVFAGENAYLADPGLEVAPAVDTAALSTWPLDISVMLCEQYALSSMPISAHRAVELGLANHISANPLEHALHCAERILTLPPSVVEGAKRVLNSQISGAVGALAAKYL